MEVYLLNEDLQRESVIDRFESLVWAERYSKVGDFELKVQSTPSNRNLFILGKKLIINSSTRVMIIEDVENNISDNGETILTITGVSVEERLQGRNTFNPMHGEYPQKWDINGTPVEVLMELMEWCSGLWNEDFFELGSFYPADTVPHPDDEISLTVSVENLFEVLKENVDIYSLGFRIVRNPENAKLYFNIYTGIDRSTAQTVNNPVIFSPGLENIQNSSHFKSVSKYRNIASVPNEVNGLYMTSNVEWPESWFDYRSVLVDADSLDVTPGDNPTYWDAIGKLAKDKLTEHERVEMLDGAVPSNAYRYGVDYNLGDIVDMQNADGLVNRMRVSEQILSDGPEGEKSYPTFELVQYITPGSWSDWKYNVEWANAEGVWEDQ